MKDLNKIATRCVKIGVYAAFTLYVCPEVLGLAGGDDDFGGGILKDQGEKLKTLVKPFLALGGIGGMAMGVMQAFKQSTLAPLLMWFGVGAGSLVGYSLLGSNMFSATVGM